MTTLQRKVLANLKELEGKPQPLSALFKGTAVSSREEVQHVVETLVKQRYIEECLGTSRMPFYRRIAAGTEVLAGDVDAGTTRKSSSRGSPAAVEG